MQKILKKVNGITNLQTDMERLLMATLMKYIQDDEIAQDFGAGCYRSPKLTVFQNMITASDLLGEDVSVLLAEFELSSQMPYNPDSSV